ncbi:hypothetical protein PSPO01_16026 [Paraphaeosphaeria sporulosa]
MLLLSSMLRKKLSATLDFRRSESLAFPTDEQCSWHLPSTLAPPMNGIQPSLLFLLSEGAACQLISEIRLSGRGQACAISAGPSPIARNCKPREDDWPGLPLLQTRQDDTGTYSPSVHSTPIGGVWVRLTACMTAGCVPASQSKRRERLERPLDQAGARRAPICLHDSIHPRQEHEVGGLDEEMSPGLGLGGADEWRAIAGSPLINVQAPDQAELSSTGSYDCRAASDVKEMDLLPTASLLGSWRHHSLVSGRALVGYVLPVLSDSEGA